MRFWKFSRENKNLSSEGIFFDEKKEVISLREHVVRIVLSWGAFGRFIHQHHRLIFSFFFITALVIVGVFSSTSRADVANFYPSQCLGGWSHPENAQNQPELSSDDQTSDFTDQNSAVLENSSAEIYCGGFTGELPDKTVPKNLVLHLSWAIADATTPENPPVINSETPPPQTFDETPPATITPDVVPDETPADTITVPETPPTDTIPPDNTSTDTVPPPASTDNSPQPAPSPVEGSFLNIFGKKVFAEGEILTVLAILAADSIIIHHGDLWDGFVERHELFQEGPREVGIFSVRERIEAIAPPTRETIDGISRIGRMDGNN